MGAWLQSIWQDIRFGARTLRKNPGIALAAASLHRMTHFSQLRDSRGDHGLVLDADRVGEPLLVHPRRIDSGLDIHIEVQHINNNTQHGINDCPPAGTAGDEQHPAVPGDDHRRSGCSVPLG